MIAVRKGERGTTNDGFYSFIPGNKFMNCPTCASDNTQRQRITYDAGTTTGTAVSHGRIHGGLFGHSANTSATIHSTQQSTMAAKCAPPAAPRMRYWLPVIGATIVWMFIAKDYFWIPAIASAYGIIVHWKRPIYQRELSTYNLCLRRYEQSWVCHKCGQMWCEEDHSTTGMPQSISNLDNELLR
jgi:hypothetical protein